MIRGVLGGRKGVGGIRDVGLSRYVIFTVWILVFT